MDSSGCLPEPELNPPPPSLPLEIIVHIFKSLGLRDRISASQTCRHWYEAGTAISLHRSEYVFIYDNLSHAIKYLAPENPIATLPVPGFQNFVFRDLEIKFTGEMRFFWRKYGPNIRSLSFQNCEVSEKSLQDILISCPNLESLQLNGCCSLFMSGQILENLVGKHEFTNLKELALMHTRYVSDTIFNRFIVLAPNIKSITLDGCTISSNDVIHKRFYLEQHRNEIVEDISRGIVPLDVAANVLTMKNIANVFAVRGKQLVSLSFRQTQLKGQGLLKICKPNELPKLKSLRLGSCFQLVNGVDETITAFCTTLEELDLSRCNYIKEQSLVHLPMLTRLKILNLNQCHAVNDQTVKGLSALKQLESLDISHNQNLTGPAIVQGLRDMRFLRHLYLNEVSIYDSESLLQLFSALSPLETLEIEYNKSPMLHTVLPTIVSRHTTLRRLSLSHSFLLSEIGLSGLEFPIIPHPTGLKEKFPPYRSKDSGTIFVGSRAEGAIYESFYKEQRDAYAEYLQGYDGQSPLGLQRMKGLRYLNLSECERVTDLTLEYVLRFKELTYLNLKKMKEVTDKGVIKVVASCPALEELILNGCEELTDDAVGHISQLCRLKKLSLYGCHRLTNCSLESLMRTRSPLRDVDVLLCSQLSHEAITIFSNWLSRAIEHSEPLDEYLYVPDAPVLP